MAAGIKTIPVPMILCVFMKRPPLGASPAPACRVSDNTDCCARSQSTAQGPLLLKPIYTNGAFLCQARLLRRSRMARNQTGSHPLGAASPSCPAPCPAGPGEGGPEGRGEVTGRVAPVAAGKTATNPTAFPASAAYSIATSVETAIASTSQTSHASAPYTAAERPTASPLASPILIGIATLTYTATDARAAIPRPTSPPTDTQASRVQTNWEPSLSIDREEPVG